MSDISAITLPSGDSYALKDKTARQGIPFGIVDSSSTSTKFNATVDGISSLQDGTCVLLKNGKVTSASGFTLNINSLGAKPVYTNLAAATRDTTIFNVNYTMLFVYDSTRVSGGAWICYRGYDSNTNYVPTGYCTTAAATAAKSVTCDYGYRDDSNYFSCLFRYANTAANATLAIASYATTAAPVYVNGARTSSSNTFGRGVIMFLYHNGAYYCYNDGRFPVLYNGSVTSVQELIASVGSVADSANTTANTALSGLQGTLIYDHTYTISNGVATFTPHVYQGGAEVTTDYAASCFEWYYRLIDGSEATLTTKSDRGCDVTITSLGYGGHVIGTFTPPE